MRSSKPVPAIDEMRSELECVLKHLQRSTSVGKFLSYICEEYFNGRADRLKEYTVAVEAFGRPESFQPKEDPIVRVHAMRLRQHLAEYYRGEGKDHRVQIRLPKGGYTPEFQLIAPEAEEVPAEQEPAAPLAVPEVEPPAVAKPPRARFAYVAAGSALLLCLLAFLGWKLYSGSHSGTLPSSGTETPATAASVSPPGEEIRILAGNFVPTYLDRLGRVWVGDRFFTGGDGAKVLYEAVSGVNDPNLWKFHRTGQAFRYDIPLKPGSYELHLFFVEDFYGVDRDRGGGEATRVIDVSANGRQLLDQFDIVRDAGGARTTDERVFLVSPASDGTLHLTFKGRVETAILSGIEIVPAPGNRMRPIRIATRTTPYISSKQVSWRPDQYYSGGHQHEIQNPVTNADDPELFATERFGNFTYTIPVAPGSYTAVMYFSESFFGTGNVTETVGGRVFDVYFDGVVILKDFDIYKEAGGAHRVVRKEFNGLHPDALGKLVFTFHPNRNNPSINAFEIISEH